LASGHEAGNGDFAASVDPSRVNIHHAPIRNIGLDTRMALAHRTSRALNSAHWPTMYRGASKQTERRHSMNAKLLIAAFAAALFSLSAHAHDCSGGANGGMDDTGNQCNDPPAVTIASSNDATSASTPTPKVDTHKAASCGKCATTRTVSTAHAPARQRAKHA